MKNEKLTMLNKIIISRLSKIIFTMLLGLGLGVISPFSILAHDHDTGSVTSPPKNSNEFLDGSEILVANIEIRPELQYFFPVPIPVITRDKIALPKQRPKIFFPGTNQQNAREYFTLPQQRPDPFFPNTMYHDIKNKFALPYNRPLVPLFSEQTQNLLDLGTPKLRREAVRDFGCLVEAIYFEARGETLEGQRAVAEVILNRVKSSDFPNTICGVVRQGGIKKARCQFSYYCDGKPEIFHESKVYLEIQNMALKFMNGHYPQIFAESTHFHASHVKPFWVSEFQYLGKAGEHHFYSH